MTQSTRNAHLAMADSRAMEEEHERENPVNPKNVLHNRRETALRNVGAGATPSMGLSQFRGGARRRKQILPGATMRAEPSEAHQMGGALSKHIGELHGAGFWNDFADGFKQGFSGTANLLEPLTNALPGGTIFNQGRKMVGLGRRDDYAQERDMENSAKYNKMLDESGMRGMSIEDQRKKRFEEARREGIAPFRDLTHGLIDAVGAIPGMSGVAGVAREGVKYLPGIGSLMGKGKTGAYEGKGRRKRAPAGANDGRRKRAEVVRQVMREKGLKMIEASKYVKEHGLY